MPILTLVSVLAVLLGSVVPASAYALDETPSIEAFDSEEEPVIDDSAEELETVAADSLTALAAYPLPQQPALGQACPAAKTLSAAEKEALWNTLKDDPKGLYDQGKNLICVSTIGSNLKPGGSIKYSIRPFYAGTDLDVSGGNDQGLVYWKSVDKPGYYLSTAKGDPAVAKIKSDGKGGWTVTLNLDESHSGKSISPDSLALTARLELERSQYPGIVFSVSGRLSAETLIPTQTVAYSPIILGVPVISGEALATSTLTASLSKDSRAAKFAYQWLRDGSAISGATSSKYKLQQADIGKQLSVRVTATSPGQTAITKTSSKTSKVIGLLEDPRPIVKTPGNKVSCPMHSCSVTMYVDLAPQKVSGVTTSYQWVKAGKPISGATNSTYSLKFNWSEMEAFLHAGYGVKVTVSKPGYRSITASGSIAGGYSQFTDVPSNHKFYSDISWLADAGITTGYRQADGSLKFLPKDNVSREAMIAFLYRANGVKNYKPKGKSPFVDVKPGDKFYQQIMWAYENKVTTGTKLPNGTRVFAPKDSITREAMAAFMYRQYGKKIPTGTSSAKFTDVPGNHKFAKEIRWMASSKITTGTKQANGTVRFEPKGATSREATAAFLHRAELKK